MEQAPSGNALVFPKPAYPSIRTTILPLVLSNLNRVSKTDHDHLTFLWSVKKTQKALLGLVEATLTVLNSDFYQKHADISRDTATTITVTALHPAVMWMPRSSWCICALHEKMEVYRRDMNLKDSIS